MAPETVEKIIGTVEKCWPVAEDLEITLEANPGSVDRSRFAALRAAGVNRVSMGIQSLNEDALKFLGREHSAADACRAVETARSLFPRYSFDLIYARPGQTPQEWERELTQALKEAGTHLSLYQLTIEEGTGFYSAEKQGKFVMPDEDVCGELYELTQEIMEGAGLPAYEISNHSAPGFECRHNLAYWRYEDYVGIGPGAHGRVREGATQDHPGFKYSTRCIRTPEAWLHSVQTKGHGLSEKTLLSPQEQGVEALMMGLRLKEGIHGPAFEKSVGLPLLSFLDPQALEVYCQAECLSWDGETLKASPYGQQRLNFLLKKILSLS
jgi:oxygen-independent coproporphyrinogen-3 oxidase